MIVIVIIIIIIIIVVIKTIIIIVVVFLLLNFFIVVFIIHSILIIIVVVTIIVVIIIIVIVIIIIVVIAINIVVFVFVTEVFLVPTSAPRLVNKGRGMCYPVCGMMHIKEPLLLIGKSSLCGGSGFPPSQFEWSFTICMTPYNRK